MPNPPRTQTPWTPPRRPTLWDHPVIDHLFWIAGGALAGLLLTLLLLLDCQEVLC